MNGSDVGMAHLGGWLPAQSRYGWSGRRGVRFWRAEKSAPKPTPTWIC